MAVPQRTSWISADFAGVPIVAQREDRSYVHIDQRWNHRRYADTSGQVAVDGWASIVQDETAKSGHLPDHIDRALWCCEVFVDFENTFGGLPAQYHSSYYH